MRDWRDLVRKGMATSRTSGRGEGRAREGAVHAGLGNKALLRLQQDVLGRMKMDLPNAGQLEERLK